MVFKRYIYKNGKKIGPYYYENKKVNGKVISTYLGTTLPKGKELGKPKSKNLFTGKYKYFIIGGVILLLLLTLINFLFLVQLRPTGEIAVLVEPDIKKGQELSGIVTLTLKQGELIPINTTMIINNSGEVSEYLLTDVLSEAPIEGSFYMREKELLGQGQGFGVAGINETLEKGFGEEYLGEDIEFSFNLEDLDLIVRQGELTITLEYAEQELISTSTTVQIIEEPVEPIPEPLPEEPVPEPPIEEEPEAAPPEGAGICSGTPLLDCKDFGQSVCSSCGCRWRLELCFPPRRLQCPDYTTEAECIQCGCSWLPGDEILPTISLGINPVDYYNDGDGSIIFDLKGSDDLNLTNISLYSNWTGSWQANQTNSSPINDTWWNVSISGIPNGVWKWGASGMDNSSNVGWSSSNRTLIVDKTSPIASFGTNPVPDYVDSDGSITFESKCSDNLNVNSLQIWGNWSGGWSAKEINSSPINDTFWNITISGIPNGVWKWGVYCDDGVGNEDRSDTNRTFSVTLSPCSLPSTLSIIEDNAENITIELGNCYRAKFAKPAAACGETLINNFSVWNGSAWSPNIVEDCGGSEYGLGFLEFFSEFTKSWIVFNSLPDSNINYELVMNTPETIVIRFNGTGTEGIQYETIWVMNNDADFIRGFHNKKFNQYIVGQQDQLAEMWEPSVLTGANDKLEITNETGSLEELTKTDSGFASAWNIFSASDLGLMNKFPFMNFYEGDSNTSTGMIVLYAQNPEQSKTIDWSSDTMDSKALLEPQIHFFGGFGVSHNPGDENTLDTLYYAGKGDGLVGDKISSEWFSPYYKTISLNNPVKAGEGNEIFCDTDRTAKFANLYSIYGRLRNYNSSNVGSSANFDRDWTVYPLGWASKEGDDSDDPSDEESHAVFSVTLKLINSTGTFEKNDTDPEIYNSLAISWVNDLFSSNGFSGNINFSVYGNSDKMLVFAKTSIQDVSATDIFVELNYTAPYTLNTKKSIDVVKLNDTAYDIRWYDPALGWIGTLVYGGKNVDKITDTGSMLRVYLLDDVIGHNNEDFNATFYIWNHEDNKSLGDITPLHTRAPVYYNQHYIKINKNDNRFGILEYGRSVILNETYYTNENYTLWFWGLYGEDITYDFYYNVTDRAVGNVSVDGVETSWSYNNVNKVLTFSVDYSSEVREIVISETIPSLNDPPQTSYIQPIPDQFPTESTYKTIIFSVHINDSDGVDDLNDSSVWANFSRPGETTRTGTCSWISDLDGFTANYSCSIDMWYWDAPGAWNISVYGEDLAGESAINNTESFTYLELKGIRISLTSLSWPSVNPGATNQTPDQNTTINNTGNYEGTLNMTGLDLYGQLIPSEFISAENFTVDVDTGGIGCNGAACLECDGTQLQNATSLEIINSLLTKGNLSQGGGTAQEDIYYCIPQVPSVSSQNYGPSLWTISV